MDLKLAEYNAEGKFERFLDLGRKPNHFVYFGDGISYIEENKEEQFPWTEHTLIKDEKDPLNRFNGLFDGRTYGSGRFVLTEDDDVYEIVMYDGTSLGYSFRRKWFVEPRFECHIGEYDLVDLKNIGNLHKNPELFSKL